MKRCIHGTLPPEACVECAHSRDIHRRAKTRIGVDALRELQNVGMIHVAVLFGLLDPENDIDDVNEAALAELSVMRMDAVSAFLGLVERDGENAPEALIELEEAGLPSVAVLLGLKPLSPHDAE